MTKAQLDRLQKNTSALQKALSDLGNAQDLAELIRIYRRPGWTTPAEFALVATAIQSLGQGVRVIQSQIKGLVAGAKLVR
jgi:hypothetical protein